MDITILPIVASVKDVQSQKMVTTERTVKMVTMERTVKMVTMGKMA